MKKLKKFKGTKKITIISKSKTCIIKGGIFIVEDISVV